MTRRTAGKRPSPLALRLLAKPAGGAAARVAAPRGATERRQRGRGVMRRCEAAEGAARGAAQERVHNTARCAAAARVTQPGASDGMHDTVWARARRGAALIRAASQHGRRAACVRAACAPASLGGAHSSALGGSPMDSSSTCAQVHRQRMPRGRAAALCVRRRSLPRRCAAPLHAAGGADLENQGGPAGDLGRRPACAVAEVAGNLRGAAPGGGTGEKDSCAHTRAVRHAKRRKAAAQRRPARSVHAARRNGAQRLRMLPRGGGRSALPQAMAAHCARRTCSLRISPGSFARWSCCALQAAAR